MGDTLVIPDGGKPGAIHQMTTTLAGSRERATA